MVQHKTPIVVAKGDGIGPEIMKATLTILQEAGSHLEIHEIEIGEKIYSRSTSTGIDPKTWDLLRAYKVFLKAPITTPQGGGFKSLNVTIRTTMGLYANIRPCISYFPVIDTKHPDMDLVVIRENEEDLYTGIEYMATFDVAESIKLISRPGSEKIIRYAFEYAKKHGRKKVTVFSKDNILKLSDGLFHKVFDQVAAEYPDIINEHWIVDIGAAKLADTPELFEVIVMPNLYGDILSDVAAQISGSVGLGGSANIGEHGAMFEAIHGSAPRKAGQNVANPSGLLLASLMMLEYIGQSDVAEKIHNAWLTTLEQGIHTYDIYQEKKSKAKVGTYEFAKAVVKNLGKKPSILQPVRYEPGGKAFIPPKISPSPTCVKVLVGCDIYIFAKPPLTHFLAKIERITGGNLHLTMITNRGVRVWPEGQPETFCVDEWRCRFTAKEVNRAVGQDHILQIQKMIASMGIDVVKMIALFTFDGSPGFS